METTVQESKVKKVMKCAFSGYVTLCPLFPCLISPMFIILLIVKRHTRYISPIKNKKKGKIICMDKHRYKQAITK